MIVDPTQPQEPWYGADMIPGIPMPYRDDPSEEQIVPPPIVWRLSDPDAVM